MLVLPGEHGPLSTIRIENIRDGLEDIELLRLYRDRHGRDAASKILERVTRNRTRFTRDPADLRAARLLALRTLSPAK